MNEILANPKETCQYNEQPKSMEDLLSRDTGKGKWGRNGALSYRKEEVCERAGASLLLCNTASSVSD